MRAAQLDIAAADTPILLNACRAAGFILRAPMRPTTFIWCSAWSLRARVLRSFPHPHARSRTNGLVPCIHRQRDWKRHWRGDDKSPALAEFIATARRVLISSARTERE